MKQLAIGFALAAALQSGFAGAQAAPVPPPPAGPHGAKPAAAAKAPPAAPAGGSTSSKYASPFADYRPFTPLGPPKGWRAANDEVREVGGHVGLMKGAADGKAEPAKGGKP